MTHLISFALVEVIIPRVLYWFLNDFIICPLFLMVHVVPYGAFLLMHLGDHWLKS